jgi:hypothetical protein
MELHAGARRPRSGQAAGAPRYVAEATFCMWLCGRHFCGPQRDHHDGVLITVKQLIRIANLSGITLTSKTIPAVMDLPFSALF